MIVSEAKTVEDAPPPQEQVLLVPGHAFFVERLELPEGLQSGEIANFAELSLETLAPFPIEQLIWGFIKDDASRGILLYATHRDRLKQLGFPELGSFRWVLPDFAPLATLRFDRPLTLRFEGECGAARLEFEAQKALPHGIVARASADAVANPEGSAVTCSVGSGGASLSEGGQPVFRFSTDPQTVPEGITVPEQIRLSEDWLWNADLRPPVYKQAERGRRRLASIVAKATVFSIYAALLLILLELVLILSQSWLGSREAKIAGQAQEVRRIEDKQSLMNKLDQVAQNELRPIAILEALNEQRPSGIYFTSTITEGRNRITVDGIATTISELNAYTASLSDSGKFKLVGNPKQITRSGRTTFTVTLDFLADTSDSESEGGQG